MPKLPRIITLSVLCVVVLILIIFFTFFRSSLQKTPQETSQDETVQQANPLEDDIPDVSPTQNTNPFSDGYKNPFE